VSVKCWRRAILLPTILLASGCAEIAISDHIASQRDDEIVAMVRRAYIVQRRADGIHDEQIRSEIPKIDRNWHIDLVLSEGDLMASTSPNQLNDRNCEVIAVVSSRRKCQESRAAERQVLRDAGVSFD